LDIKLDHIFILTQNSAPAVEELVKLGLLQGLAKDHPGQGTANRLFLFENMTLELLYIRDPKEAENGAGRNLNLVSRIENAHCPFGIVVRTPGTLNEDPFAGWRYYPEYFPEHWYFQVGDNSVNEKEPLVICMPKELPQRKFTKDTVTNKMNLEGLNIALPGISPSSFLSDFKCDGISFSYDSEYLLELKFNSNPNSSKHDLRPLLPLIINL